MQVLLNRIDADRMLAVQNAQNTELLYLADTVNAASQKLGSVAVSNLGHFYCRYIFVSYTTVEGAVAADTGIDYLSGKLIDGSNNRPIFDDYIPFGLWSVPGRRQSIAGSGNASFQSHIIFPLEYMFTVNSNILLDVKNVATLQPNSYSIVFHGVRVKSSVSTSGL